MKKNNIFKLITVVLILLIIVAIALYLKNHEIYNYGPPTEPVSENITIAQKESEKESVTVEWTSEESTTEETTTEEITISREVYDAVKTGVWYLYDEKAKTAYAFDFTGKDRVEIAYFDKNNAEGLDAKYFTTSEDYEINDVEGDIIIELEDPINSDTSFMFTVKDGKIRYGKDVLPNEKEISLDTVFNHFNE